MVVVPILIFGGSVHTPCSGSSLSLQYLLFGYIYVNAQSEHLSAQSANAVLKRSGATALTVALEDAKIVTCFFLSSSRVFLASYCAMMSALFL